MALNAEMARNQALKATLSKLKAPSSASNEPPAMTEVQLKAQSKLRVIELSKKELELKQSIEQMELTVRQTQAMIKEKQQDLKAIQADMDKERSSGMAVWETVGITTQSYRDPFHTGLSKRTPNGGYFTS